MLFVNQDAVHRADLLALGLIVMPDTLRAEVGIDFLNFFALRNGVVGAFWFAHNAVDAFVGNKQ